jgi:hypothetical protein
MKDEPQITDLIPEQIAVFEKYNLPVNPKLAIGRSPNLIEALILSQLGKNGNEIVDIMGVGRLSKAMANR